MDNQKKIIAVLLFIATCTPSYVMANDLDSDGVHIQQMHTAKEIYATCLELGKTLSDKEHSQLLRELDIRRELSCSCELFAEIKEEESHQGNRDQQADILEKLLLGSTQELPTSSLTNKSLGNRHL